jgi:signal transduction histidine kinase
MPTTSKDTCFASAARDDGATIESQHRLVCSRDIPMVLDAIPVVAMVLNHHRQVVFGNRRLLTALGIDDLRQVLGQRPGEVFRCRRVPRSPSGCGTSDFCIHCGAVRSILLGLAGREAVRECTMLRENDAGDTETLELMISSTPVDLEGETYLIFTITDISHEKRRRALERIFFHDVLNTVGGIQGLMGYLAEEVPENLREDAQLIHRVVEQLTEEIGSQRQLLAAEANELESQHIPLYADEMLVIVACAYRNIPLAADKRIETHSCPCETPFVSDPVLLRRVLGNLVKNALEATTAGGRVALGCEIEDSAVTFWVQNEAAVPDIVRPRVFERSFSTKGEGRGLGTYGARLLTERYLGGTVSFASNEAEGTVFRVRLPLNPAREEQ